jgi:hypothetical protein
MINMINMINMIQVPGSNITKIVGKKFKLVLFFVAINFTKFKVI